VLVPMVLCVTPLQQYLAGGFAGPNGGAFWAVWGFTAPLAAALWLDGLTTGIVLVALGLGIGTTLIAETLWPLSVPALPAGILRLLVLLNVVSFGPVVVLGIRYAAQNRLQLARDLEREVRRSDALLLNVLPAAIAERLKTRPGRIAERFDPVTVLFADVVGFTPLASRMEPEQLVELLDDVFTRFDALAERLGLEKIKTIGDAYLVVGGLPAPRSDHAQAVADMALGMLRALVDVRERSGLALDLRIGMHTGPVVAGVIGTHKFAYDLWGDAVNIAARMESHGAAGSIQVSADTAVLLQREFILEERGGVELKGRGAVSTWWLRGRRPEGGVSAG